MNFKKVSGKVFYNLSVDDLIKKAVERNEGEVSRVGALTVRTGKYTGRSPGDRFIVDSPGGVHENIDWGDVNKPISEKNFDKLYKKIVKYISGLDEIFVFDGCVGADNKYAHTTRVINEFAYENLFIRHLLRRLKKSELKNFEPGLTVIVAPGCLANPKEHGTNSEAFVILNFKKKVILIGGTKYCGEQKKSIFSYMSYILPNKGVFPMHSSVNVDKRGSNVTVFFGLSGTGKTTLSSDASRIMIGDDEHGWSIDGVFNFEGGCYAKCINLTRKTEPEIYDSIKRGAIVENVIMNSKGEYDFFDSSLTHNTRVAYPLNFLESVDLRGIAGHPKTVIFLTADAFGVIPPVSKLSHEQAMYHFLSGYTSKVAGTERGVEGMKATFSKYFGEPFMPRKPRVYANLLRNYIGKHGVNVFLVNTGWTGGPYGVGKRFPIKITREIVRAAMFGELDEDKVEYEKHEIFNLNIPKSCPGVSSKILNPVNTWKDKNDYERHAKKLAKLFKENFREFKGIPRKVADAGPK